MAGAAVLRETNGLLLRPLGMVLLLQARRHRLVALRMVLFALAPVAAMAAYYGYSFAAAGPGAGHESVPLLAYFRQTPLLEGLGGVLVSPGRGLFVYSPVLLFSLAGMAWAWQVGARVPEIEPRWAVPLPSADGPYPSPGCAPWRSAPISRMRPTRS